ncbi:hypothetical protein [Rathayibacter agropyri]|uniref:hypothetical protein n=1 Tax=Rathayibacter agropyri TaxID=1634927 RepID=UPI0015630C7B|nr:hypothetical protein [Rathayibacter agropyri]NRD08999.1 hypothetical protein [Rathayibacter agropyri]
MTQQRNRAAASWSPWGFLAVAFVGTMAGNGVSAVLGAVDPWKPVIIAITQAVVLLIGWAVLNHFHRRRSSNQSGTG